MIYLLGSSNAASQYQMPKGEGGRTLINHIIRPINTLNSGVPNLSTPTLGQSNIQVRISSYDPRLLECFVNIDQLLVPIYSMLLCLYLHSSHMSVIMASFWEILYNQA